MNKHTATLRHLLLAGSAVLANLVMILVIIGTLSDDPRFDDSHGIVPPAEKQLGNSILPYMDGDALSMYSFYTGMADGDSFGKWVIGTCPLFFPNMALYGTVFSIFHGHGTILLVYMLMQLAIIYMLLFFLLRQIGAGNALTALALGASFSSLFGLMQIYGSIYDMYYHLLMPYHTGLFVNTLISLNLLFYYIRSRKMWLVGALFIVMIVSMISNPLYGVYFGAPVLAIGILSCLSRFRPNILWTATVAAGSIIGLYGFKQFGWFLSNIPSTPDHWASLSAMLSDFAKIATGTLAGFMILLLTVTSFVYALIFCGKAVLKKLFGSARGEDYTAYELYQLYFIPFFVFSLSAPVIAGNYFHTSCVSYILYTFILGVFNSAVIISYHSQGARAQWAKWLPYLFTGAFVGFIVFQSICYSPINAFRRVSSYRSAVAEAADALKERFPLKCGVGWFWMARPADAFSDKNIHVVTTFSGLNIWHHVNNIDSYRFVSNRTKQPAVYNFVILEQWEDTLAVRRFFNDSVVRVSQNGFDFYLVPEFYYDEQYVPQRNGRFEFGSLMK